jgi:hypothetical protein
MMYFRVEGVDPEWGEAVEPVTIEAEDLEAAMKQATKFGMKFTKITQASRMEHLPKAKPVAVAPNEQTGPTVHDFQTRRGAPMVYLLVIAGIAALSMLAAYQLGMLKNVESILRAATIYYWSVTALALFSTAWMLALLADIADSLRTLRQRRHPPGDD